MIKPNELRLGNYVKYPFHELQVCQLFVDSFQGMYVGGKGCYMYESCDGIPLTSEWLPKFGFEKTTGLTWSFSYGNTYSVYRKSGLAYNEIKVEWRYDGILLKKQPDSVHELQNLYYALTGEELTIQEKEIEPPMMGMSY